MKTKYLRMANKPMLALLIPLLGAAALVLPAFGAQAGAVFTSLYSFSGTNDGANPRAGLVQGSDGNLYGTTVGGGTNNLGTVFKISTSGALTSLYSFTGTNDGANPYASLVQGSDGNFYGTTETGGTNNLGAVFKITTNGVLTSLYSFEGTNDGTNPHAGLVQGSDGNLYGTTGSGGTNNLGAVFKITTNGVLTSLYSFEGTNDGANPYAPLVQGSDGNFYGTTEAGGTNDLGTVFKITTNGALTSVYSFTGVADGAYPLAGLVQGSDGNLYGTTAGHGPFFYPCAVFQISTNGALNPLYSFNAPWVESPSGLVQGSDGNFYGATFGGGRYSNGSVFNISTNGALTNLYSFSGGKDGGLPQAALVQGSDGNFYGTTGSGGTNNVGTVFRLTVEPVFQAVVLTNGARILTWSVEAGGTYQLQYRRDWTSVNWINLGSPVIATGATHSFTDPSLIDPWRVYRVELLP